MRAGICEPAHGRMSTVTTEQIAPGSDDLPPAAPEAALHDVVLDRLGQAIVSGDYPAGTVLRADELSARFGVSRSVVREVVRVLQSLGLVASRRRVGITVQPRQDWSFFDPRLIGWRLAGNERPLQLTHLTQLRLAVEPVAAGLAAQNATGNDCARLTEAVMGMAATGRSRDLEAYLKHDIDFHVALLEASGNELFASLSSVVAAVLTGRTRHDLMPDEPEHVAIALHRDVADAIQRGDAAAAETAMRHIVSEAHAAMTELLHAQDPTPQAG